MSIDLQTTLSDDLARVLNLRDTMQREVLDHLRADFPVHSLVFVDYQRNGQVYTINGTVTGHDARQGAAEVCVRNNDTGKSRRFDVRCYRIRSQWSGGWGPDERVTPRPDLFVLIDLARAQARTTPQPAAVPASQAVTDWALDVDAIAANKEAP